MPTLWNAPDLLWELIERDLAVYASRIPLSLTLDMDRRETITFPGFKRKTFSFFSSFLLLIFS